jgi:hypothetical protein
VEATGTKEEPAKRTIYDHRSPVELSDGKYAVLELRYINPGFEGIMLEIVQVLDRIWANKFNIFKFWCIKNAENPAKAKEIDEEKDSYDRRDNYDAQGIAVYLYLNFKHQINLIFG